MESPIRVRVATLNCVADDFGGEIVALNLDSGYYFSLRELASGIWTDLAAGHSVPDVLAAFSDAAPSLTASASNLIDELLAYGLLVADPDGTPVAAPLQVSAMLTSGVSTIAFEAYDDMRDLVTTDPIHEVDEEAGWPVRRVEG